MGLSSYQSFEDSDGSSKSADKLAAIKLPDDLTGRSVLDLGCNEGYFCRAALNRDAMKVVGIDEHAPAIDSARKRVPEGSFYNTSWWDIPDEKYDIVLFLSAIHYEPRPADLLDKIARHLTPNGLLILECGLASGGSRASRVWTERKGIAYHPNWSLLSQHWLRSYAFRRVGRSVDQGGDPVPRHVFHASVRKPVVMIVTGASDSGKTSLTRLFDNSDPFIVSTDTVVNNVLGIQRPRSALSKVMDELNSSGISNVRRVVEVIRERELEEEFADLIADHVEFDVPLVLIEGYGLTGPIRERLWERLGGDARVWACEPLDGRADKGKSGSQERFEALEQSEGDSNYGGEGKGEGALGEGERGEVWDGNRIMEASGGNEKARRRRKLKFWKRR